MALMERLPRVGQPTRRLQRRSHPKNHLCSIWKGFANWLSWSSRYKGEIARISRISYDRTSETFSHFQGEVHHGVRFLISRSGGFTYACLGMLADTASTAGCPSCSAFGNSAHSCRRGAPFTSAKGGPGCH